MGLKYFRYNYISDFIAEVWCVLTKTFYKVTIGFYYGISNIIYRTVIIST